MGYDIDSSLRLGHRYALSSLRFPGGIGGQLQQFVDAKTIDTAKDGR
jgi:hypothetical protein